ncbi:hypothetical protein [Moraxella lacunata]
MPAHNGFPTHRQVQGEQKTQFGILFRPPPKKHPPSVYFLGKFI